MGINTFATSCASGKHFFFSHLKLTLASSKHCSLWSPHPIGWCAGFDTLTFFLSNCAYDKTVKSISSDFAATGFITGTLFLIFACRHFLAALHNESISFDQEHTVLPTQQFCGSHITEEESVFFPSENWHFSYYSAEKQIY